MHEIYFELEGKADYLTEKGERQEVPFKFTKLKFCFSPLCDECKQKQKKGKYQKWEKDCLPLKDICLKCKENLKYELSKL